MLGFYAKWLADYEDAQCPGKPGCPGGNDHGALSSTIPFAKHVPPVDPSWPTSYCQIAMLLYKYSGDESVIKARYQSIKKYVDFLPTPTKCSSCKAPTNSITHPPGHPELLWYYMNGDWMEYEGQPAELAESGPLLSSYHYILDVSLLGEMAEILGNTADSAKYKALAHSLWPVFNAVYLSHDHAPPSPPAGAVETCAESQEIKKGGHSLQLGCKAAGSVIDRVLFASFGSPSGSCASGFAHNASCDAPDFMPTVEKLCNNKRRCTLTPTVGPGGIIKRDPCTGTIKTLAVQVHCHSGSAPPPSPPAPPAQPLFSYATPGQAAGQLEQVVMLGRFPSGEEGPIPEEHRADVEQTLLNKLAEADNHITTGFIGNKYAWPALSAMGQVHLALDIALGTTCPSYGYQVAQGATTLWENWSGTDVDDTSPMTGQGPSHNHHFLGGIGQWLQSDLVGLQQSRGSTAFSHPLIAPRIVNHTDLPHAAGRWDTPRGLLEVSWKFATGLVSLNVSTPPNTVATVIFPCKAEAIIEAATTAGWHGGEFTPGTSPGVEGAALRTAGLDAGLVAFTAGGGSYEFSGQCI